MSKDVAKGQPATVANAVNPPMESVKVGIKGKPDVPPIEITGEVLQRLATLKPMRNIAAMERENLKYEIRASLVAGTFDDAWVLRKSLQYRCSGGDIALYAKAKAIQHQKELEGKKGSWRMTAVEHFPQPGAYRYGEYCVVHTAAAFGKAPTLAVRSLVTGAIVPSTLFPWQDIDRNKIEKIDVRPDQSAHVPRVLKRSHQG